MKKTFSLLISFLLSGMSAFATNVQNSIELTTAERQFVQNNNDFAFHLFSQVRGDNSRVLSPLSITYALGLLNNGAQGVTKQEINMVLGTQSERDEANDTEVINQFCLKLLHASRLVDEDTKVGIANTIYFNGDRNDLSLKKSFTEAAAYYYDAKPQVLRFSDVNTRDIINDWAFDRTDGMIKELLKEDDVDFNDPNLVSLLLNAISFKGAWTSPFNKDRTMNTYFNNGKSTAMMMFQIENFDYADNDLYQSVVLPYGNGAFQMTLFLPRYGKTLDDLIAAMNGKNWNTAKYEHCQVYLSMPRIQTTTDLNLNEVMKSLGMPNAFYSPDAEGFTEFCYEGDNEADSHRVWISLMKQSAKLNLDEVGTEAAAATAVAIVDRAMPLKSVEFMADRPFLYVISERSTGAIFFMGQYMGEAIKNLRHDINLTDDEKQLVNNNNDFAFRLYRKIRGNDNQVFSPLSVTYALGLLNNGATDQTKQEINNVLGAGLNDNVINDFCRKMLTESWTLDEQTKVSIANTIFMNKDYELKPSFVEKANDYYDAKVQTRDFYDGQTLDAINEWANNCTNGMIKEILNEQTFDPSLVSYLLNAIYFKGTWANKFNKANTHEESFNGNYVVDMMHQQEEFNYIENDTYQAVILPYGNNSYSMTVFLPRENKTLDDVLNVLNSSNWKKHDGEYMVDLKLPRFEIDSDINLKNPLSELGMPSAFIYSPNGFENFCNVPTYIDLIKQSAKIKVDEEGTEAAAVTIIGYATSSIPREAKFHANRPFFYIISERSTGVIFFMGQYVGGSTSRPVQTTAISGQEKIMDKGKCINGNDVNGGWVYDLQGRKLSEGQGQLRKGLYIQGGKKFVKP